MNSSVIEFIFFKYLLLLSFIIPGIYLINNKVSNRKYWGIISPSIIIYSLMEGLRWMRGTDYIYNYDIANLRQFSRDVFYDFIAYALNSMNFPFYVFFILISFTLIFSLSYLILDFKKAFLFCMILMYAFSMGQSENLMRQYFAITFLIISVKLFNEFSFKSSLVVFILGVLSHSSIIIILPFIALFILLKLKNKLTVFVLNNLKFIALFLYFSCLIFSDKISSIVNNFNLSDYFLGSTNLDTNQKYLTDDYVSSMSKITDVKIESQSLIFVFRRFYRSIVIIIFGFDIILPVTGINFNSNAKFFIIKDSKILIFYLLSLFGLLLPFFIPNNLESEVISRVTLYFEIWIYFIEGLIFYKYLTNVNHFNSIYFILLFLLLLECIWVFNIYDSPLGYQFIWN